MSLKYRTRKRNCAAFIIKQLFYSQSFYMRKKPEKSTNLYNLYLDRSGFTEFELKSAIDLLVQNSHLTVDETEPEQTFNMKPLYITRLGDEAYREGFYKKENAKDK